LWKEDESGSDYNKRGEYSYAALNPELEKEIQEKLLCLCFDAAIHCLNADFQLFADARHPGGLSGSQYLRGNLEQSLGWSQAYQRHFPGSDAEGGYS
jgi:hypothetical protein